MGTTRRTTSGRPQRCSRANDVPSNYYVVDTTYIYVMLHRMIGVIMTCHYE